MIDSESTLAVGIVVSLLVWEVSRLSPGGLVVPAYAVMHLSRPGWLAGIVLSSLLAYGAFQFFKKYTLLYGRRRFTLMILSGMVAKTLVTRLSLVLPWLDPGGPLDVLGNVVPGLVANDFEQQGVLPTLAASVLATAVTFGVLHMVEWLSAALFTTFGGM